ncbi:MAG TPA: glutamine-hydrolyzing carbamoyl-phosphate synthase small subunit [Candidatus Omnitrophota bacterium]|nr:glutamine-hydrolyzing carbamoyl-phosphate synthase small subunit [Candidatus Omnitrophota bacterium]
MKAILALEDGLILEGESFGLEGETQGEVVFNTSMMGYQEILTDPSYKGQIVTMTYPHIGNYGINSEDVESFRPHVEGFVIRELSGITSNWRSEESLDEYLRRNRIVGIEGVDTRMLTKHLRDFGAKRGIISTVDLDGKRLVKRARNVPSIVGQDLVKEVTCREAYDFEKDLPPSFGWPEEFPRPKKEYFAVCVDGGIKFNILRKLRQHGFRVKVVPASSTWEQILQWKPDGVFYSNGPGDPEPVQYLWGNMQKLIGKVPVFGICLGHQMLGLALGGKTFKLKFGHRGANHPVMDLKTGKVEITTQNHGFCVDSKSLGNEVEQTHINLNDKTLEGIRHRKYPVFSVQYHPESSAGPHDSDYLFSRFYQMIDKGVW